MGRIIYALFAQGAVTGGHKVIVRHVEALRALGFDAVCAQGPQNKTPDWFDFDAPIIGAGVEPGDVVVAPDDAPYALRSLAKSGARVVVITQNPFYMAAVGFEALDAFAPERFPPVLAVSPGLAGTLRRAYPQAKVELVPCFADERLFRPAPSKRLAIAYAPRKRPLEANVIRQMFRKFHPRHADLDWVELSDVTETKMAQALGEASLFLSLSRMESVGMTPLEAMASGCVCAGFTGIGGREFATTENGFWVGEDECEAAADALAAAADLVKAGGAPLQAHLQAGAKTADAWSHARFSLALEAAWMRLAPEMRTLSPA